MAENPKVGCSIKITEAKPYMDVRLVFGGYSEAGEFKPFELLSDLDGDRKPELGMTMEEPVSWGGEGCITSVKDFGALTEREKQAVRDAIRFGRNSLTLRRTYIVALSGIPEHRSSKMPHSPLLTASSMDLVDRMGGGGISFSVPLLDGHPVKIGDLVQIDRAVAGGVLFVRWEKSHAEVLKKKEGSYSMAVEDSTSSAAATEEVLQSQFSLDPKKTVASFRVVNITPGPVEEGCVAPELTRLSLIPDENVGILTTAETFTREDGTRVTDTTMSVLEVPSQMPGIKVQERKSWFQRLFE